MESNIMKVDKKGRLHIPKQVRDRLGIKSDVRASIQDGAITIEPAQAVLDRLAKEVKFDFGSVEDELPRLRKAADEQLLRETK